MHAGIPETEGQGGSGMGTDGLNTPQEAVPELCRGLGLPAPCWAQDAAAHGVSMSAQQQEGEPGAPPLPHSTSTAGTWV